jgi:hypothetical protein
MSQFEGREHRIMRPLLEFFSHNANFKQFLDVVVFKTRNLPLRLLDWFVTNYSKKNDVCYKIKRPNGILETFRVYRSYRAQLKGSKKKEFDPFCRGETITLEYESPVDGEKVAFETAICQLKFFKWAIENLVLDYVETNYNPIYEDMKLNNSKSSKETLESANVATAEEQAQAIVDESIKKQTERKRKTELSKSIYQKIHVSNQPITFDFAHSQSIIVS